MQETEVQESVMVQTQESEDDTHRYNSIEATVPGIPVINQRKTNKAQRIRDVLPSSPDLLTGSLRIMITTPTPAAKKVRYMGPGGSAWASGIYRRLSFKVEGKNKGAEEVQEDQEEEESSYRERRKTKWTTKTKSRIQKMRRLPSSGPRKLPPSC